MVPVGAGMLAAMVEILHVLALERLDLALDEGVELGELADGSLRQREIHGVPSDLVAPQ
jgi:hypothetical protein